MTPEEYNKYLSNRTLQIICIPMEIPVKETIGKSVLGLMCPQIPYVTDHGAIPLLQGYAQDGCPVDCGKNWTREHMDLMLERVPHQSANRKKAEKRPCASFAKRLRTRLNTNTPVW